MRRRNTKEKLILLCTLTLVFALMPSPFPVVVPADAAFSSVTITDVKPAELHPGDTRAVTVTVKNNGGQDARDIRLAFQGTETVSLVGPTVAHINTLNSWSSKDVEIVVHVKEEAANGVYSIPVACSWRGHYFNTTAGYVTTEPIAVPLGISFSVVGVGVINVGDVTTDPLEIRPGDEDVELKAVIENSGEAAAKDVEARLLYNAEFKSSWSGTDRSYIGRLNSGDSKEAIFHIDIADSIESNTYRIPLRIRYKDTRGREYEVTHEINILVEPKPEFEVSSYHTEPAKISAGDNSVELHVSIRNIGSGKAEAVSARITGEADVPFDYEVKSDYAGNVEVGEEREVILEFDVEKKALSKVYSQGIEIRCTGDRDLGDDNVYIFDEQIQLEVTSSSSGGSSLPGFEVLFALLALVFVMRGKRV